MGTGASGRQQDERDGSASHQQAQPEIATALENGEVQGFIAVARIGRPQGRKGELLAEILTDFPSRFAELQRAYLGDPGKEPQAVTIENTWLHKGKVVLKFAGIDSISDAEPLRGRYVLIPEVEKIALSSHQYYLWELTGCQVVVELEGERKPLGTVTVVERTGGVDVLHVSDNSRELLIPFAQEICKIVDPKAKLIVIEPPEDLLDLNQNQTA